MGEHWLAVYNMFYPRDAFLKMGINHFTVARFFFQNK